MKLSHLALSTALSFYALPALAEEADDENQTIIVTASTQSDEAEVRANQTPGGTDIIRHEDYADKSLMSLRDTLAFSPGVYLQPRYGQEVRISIRGSGLSRGYHMRGLTLLQDGIPINLADDNGDFQELEPIFFDHLEVYRGSNALRFGSGTLGGAINGVTPTGRTSEGIYVRGDVGSFDTYRGLVSAGIASDRVDAWAAISTDTSEGDREHSDRSSLRFHGNVGLILTDTISTRFYGSYNNIDQEIPGALTQEQALTDPNEASPSTIAGDNARDIDSIRLQNRTSFDFGGAKLDVGAFLNVKSLYHPIFQVIDQKSNDRGVFARLDYEAGPFSFTLGGENRFGDVKSKRFVNLAGDRGALTFEADMDARTTSLYGEVRYHPVDKLSLIVGGIYTDGYRKQRALFNRFAGGAQEVTGRASFDEFSPKFGILYEATPDIEFYANYSRSAEFPGFIELSQIASFVPVEAQTAWTGEIGTRGTVGIASWDVSLYRSEIKGELLQFKVAQDVPASTFNAEDTLHQGIEAALTLEPLPWLRIRQVYQYSDFRFQDDAQYGDNRLPVVPRHVYRGEIRLGTDAMHIAPHIEWMPQGAFADYQNSVRTKGYALLGVTAGAKLTDSIDLFLDARNLTGKKAIGDISAVIDATAVDAITGQLPSIYNPVERRAIFGGIRARF
ncbi:MAG: TonB-dependent receptor [Parasphingorhabdus sp.]|uniref:TonB-dependent receptor family protein n=1 Tax=Parasphingorhabdus sp. TaxID=2709688 RepID=UPI0030011FC0